jgi:TPR repeat protein
LIRFFKGYYAYEIERNYTKAAQYWKECFDRTHDANCAHNLVRFSLPLFIFEKTFYLIQGVMWTAGHYPPDFTVNHVQAWQYYSFAAQRGQIDSKIVVAFYNARNGHPAISRNPWVAAM